LLTDKNNKKPGQLIRCFMLNYLQREMREIKELRSKVAKLVDKLQEEAEQRQVSQRDWV